MGTAILIVVTSFAHEKVSGLEPAIRTAARSQGDHEGVEMCAFGPVNYDGFIVHDPQFLCSQRNQSRDLSLNTSGDASVPTLTSLEEVGKNSLAQFASFFGVLFDCGFILGVYDDRFLSLVLRRMPFDSTPAMQACQESHRFNSLLQEVIIAQTANDTTVSPSHGEKCAYVPWDLLGSEFPPQYPGNRSAGPNKWMEVCGMMGPINNKTVFEPTAITVHGIYEYGRPPTEGVDAKGHHMLRMVVTCPPRTKDDRDRNTTIYIHILPKGKPAYSTECINANANRLPSSFTSVIREHPCTNISFLENSWKSEGDYTCRQGVLTQTANWDKWMSIYNRVRKDFAVTFLAIQGGPDDMYAIYTGLLGALFGAAAATVPALLMSVGVTL